MAFRLGSARCGNRLETATAAGAMKSQGDDALQTAMPISSWQLSQFPVKQKALHVHR
jgi:hypothetical protein